jgi:hypothetical protein
MDLIKQQQNGEIFFLPFCKAKKKTQKLLTVLLECMRPSLFAVFLSAVLLIRGPKTAFYKVSILQS